MEQFTFTDFCKVLVVTVAAVWASYWAIVAIVIVTKELIEAIRQLWGK